MVLFADDWKKYPGISLHLTTQNQSWVRLAGIYKLMGIRNHAFLLALHNKELEHVDPYSEELTSEQIYAIAKECKDNPWYFFREVLRIKPAAGNKMIHFEANRGNIATLWLYFNHITTLLIMIRQTGKSVTIESLIGYLANIACLNTDIQLLSKDDGLRVKTVGRIKALLETLPPYLQFRDKKSQDTTNTEKLTVKRLGNTIITSVSQASPRAAEKVGRGMTAANNFIDEFGYILNNRISIPAMLASGGAAREQAEANHEPYGTLFATTTAKLVTDEGRYAYEIYQNGAKWNEVMFDLADNAELREVVKKNSKSKSPIMIAEFNYKQLGKTKEWIQARISEAFSEGESAEADFLNIWPNSSEEMPFEKMYADQMIESKITDGYQEVTSGGYIITWYIPDRSVLHSKPFVAGLDTSEAIGNDNISMVMRDIYTGEVLGVSTVNEVNTVHYSQWVCDLMAEYPTMVLIPERKNVAISIIDNLLLVLVAANIDPFKRIFNWVVETATNKDSPEYRDVISQPMNRRNKDVYVKYRKEFGFNTSGSGRASREALYGASFSSSVKHTSRLVRHPNLINQLTRLIRKNGRIDHRPNEHDDEVIGWLLGYWFLTNASNLMFYGINPMFVLSNVKQAEIEEQGGIKAIAKQQIQDRLKNELSNLIENIKSTKDKHIRYTLIRRAKMLYDELETDNRAIFNIETLIENIKTEQNNQRRWG